MSSKTYRRRLEAFQAASHGVFDRSLSYGCRQHEAKAGEPCYALPFAICGKRVRL